MSVGNFKSIVKRLTLERVLSRFKHMFHHPLREHTYNVVERKVMQELTLGSLLEFAK